MCTHATEEGHRNFTATLDIAQNKTRPTAERQTACYKARMWGSIGTPHPSGVDPVPFCRLISDGRAQAYKLWVEELSPQARRELDRRAAEDATPR